MKKIINSILLVAAAGMMMYSCSTKVDLPTETYLKTITTSDTTIVDCFTPLSDITIYIGGDTITVTSDGEFDQELEEWLTNMEPFSIQFPVDIELADGTTFTLNNMNDLIDVLEDCGVDFDVHEDEEEDDDDSDSDDDGDSDDDSDDDTDSYDDDCILNSPCGTYTYNEGISISSDSLDGEITIIVFDDNVAIDTITCQGSGIIELVCDDESDDDSDSDDDGDSDDDSDDDTDSYDDDCILNSPCGTYTYGDDISISSDSLDGEITIIVFDANMAIDTITCQGSGIIELICDDDESDDDSDSDDDGDSDDTDESDDDTDESDDDTDESDDDTDESDDDADESDDDTDESDDDTDESDDDADESDDDTDESDDDTDESDDDTDESDDDTDGN